MKLRKQLVAIVLMLVGASAAIAQQMPPIPLDPQVRIGKLASTRAILAVPYLIATASL